MKSRPSYSPENRLAPICISVREHAMAAITNGIQLPRRAEAYCATFLFSDYMKNA